MVLWHITRKRKSTKVTVFKYIKRVFSVASGDRRKKSNSIKLQQKSFRLSIRKAILTMKMAKFRYRLSRHVMKSPSLKIFKSRLNKHLNVMF